MKRKLLFAVTAATLATMVSQAARPVVTTPAIGPDAAVAGTLGRPEHLPGLQAVPGADGRGIVHTPPEDAVITHYYRSAKVLSVAEGQDAQLHYVRYTDLGFDGQIAVTPAGDVYMFNPLSAQITDSWMYGKLSDDGKQIVVPLPCPIAYIQGAQGGMMDLERYIYIPEDNQWVRDDANRQLVYNIADDGTISMEVVENMALTLVDRFDGPGTEYWWIYSDWEQVYEPMTETVQTLPEGEVEEWQLRSVDTFTAKQRVLTAVEKDNTLYLKNWIDEVPEGVLTFTLSDNEAVMTAPQYMGVADYHHIYALACTPASTDETEESGEYVKTIDALRLTWNPETRMMSTRDYLVFNWGREPYYDVEYYMRPDIQMLDPDREPLPLRKPMISSFIHYNPEYGFGSITFEIYSKDVDGNLIEPQNITYSLFFDDEPWMLRAEYYDDIDEDTPNIPYGYQIENKLLWNGNVGKMYLWTPTTYFSKLSLVAYNDTKGHHIPSEAWVVPIEPYPWGGNAIDSVDGEAAVQATTLYTLDGRRIESAAAGTMVLRVDTLTDGTRRVTKQIAR